jgi:GH15 family glucan-1,4-alpha-glucosidase
VTGRRHQSGDADGDPGVRYHVLRDYAVVADGERGIVVGPDGAMVWMCFPAWHDAAIFSSLVGGQGHYAVTPEAPYVWGGHYEDGALIWRSRWVTTESVVECREALAAPARRDRAVVVRRIMARSGAARVRVELLLRGSYGRTPTDDVRRDEQGRWVGRSGGVWFRWTGAADAVIDAGGVAELHLVVEEGQHHDLVLELGHHEPSDDPPHADLLWEETEAHWSATVPALDHVVAQRDARHAYAVLAGLTSASGGMVASATTSLPERADAGRNYDYRYVWIRDQTYAGIALAAVGDTDRLDPLVDFVAARLLDEGARLAPAYTVDGARPPREEKLGLPGYPGGTDIVGNRARDQFQLDVFGEALSLFAAADRSGRLSTQGWRAAELAARAIAAHHGEPDAGVWELERRRWTHSRLACVAGLRAISGAPGAPRAPVAEWTALADQVLAETAQRSTHPSGRWQRSPDDPAPDAALLLGSIRGAVPASDPRSVATHRAVVRDLTEDGYVYRFRHDARPLHDAEGAFLLCGFWTALSCRAQGRLGEARTWFERTRSSCSTSGLFSEEYDVVQRQLRGNLPQAFVHAALLECAASM